MKRALIVHGWDCNSNDYWYQDEKKALEALGYEAKVPDMPSAVLPAMEKWVKVVSDFRPGENDILIGHSLGTTTILRYLEKSHQKVDKVFLIAAFARDLNEYFPTTHLLDPITDFATEKPFNWKKIKSNYNECFVINQKDDVWVPKECGIEVAEKLGANLKLVDGTNHFSKIDLSLINKHIHS